MKKVGILGGTFDPPHFGHMLIANEVLHQLKLDEIWFMPNQEPPHKERTEKIATKHRLNMLQLAIQDEPKFKIEPIELKRPGPSYTFDTIKLLKEKYKDHKLYFIIGADMIEYLPNWYKIDELMNLITFVGVNRPNYMQKTTYPIIYVNVPEFNVSSSLIRNRIKKGETVKYLLPDSIIQYIKENRLYGAK